MPGVTAIADDGGEPANYPPDKSLSLAQLSTRENGCAEGAQQRAAFDCEPSVKGVSKSTPSKSISNPSASCLDGLDEDTAVMLRYLLKTILRVCGGGAALYCL